jgi:hypothetical protein
MTHQDIEDRDVVDRYVRGGLDLAEREAFEGHFFECDACFAAVREVERLTSAVAEAAQAGLLRDELFQAEEAGAPAIWTWMPLAASVLLLAGLGWMTLKQVPQLRSELAETREERDRLQARVAAAATSPGSRADLTVPEANVPVAMLQTERGAAAEPPAVTVPATASHVIVWISAPPAPTAVRLVVLSSDGREVSRIDGLTRNGEGAYVVSLPAAVLPSGIYRLRLVAGADAGPSLIGEYLLRVSATR